VRGILAAGDGGLDAVRRTVDAADANRDRLRETGALRPFADAPLLPPIPDPNLILSEGLNYRRHLEEMSGTPTPPNPTAFVKAASSLNGSGKPIPVPPQCPDMIDFEGEFTFVVGRRCHNVPVEDAMSHIGGYTICNDVSARDWVGEVFAAEAKFGIIQAWERNIMGKQLPGFTPCGPVMVTADEIADPHDLQLTTTLNGEVVQSTKTDDLIFGVAEILSYFSRWYRFEPGDLFTTGSPAGVGFGRDPKLFMKPGDRIEVEVEGIGRLSNTLAG
jgi:2-keto-4-pentenoate hydratase/2-oxohepta-3-ene-1,7-dioic acid hydratase in catechol pathway